MNCGTCGNSLNCDRCGVQVPVGDRVTCPDCYFHDAMGGRDDEEDFILSFIKYLQSRLDEIRGTTGRAMN